MTRFTAEPHYPILDALRKETVATRSDIAPVFGAADPDYVMRALDCPARRIWWEGDSFDRRQTWVPPGPTTRV